MGLSAWCVLDTRVDGPTSPRSSQAGVGMVRGKSPWSGELLGAQLWSSSPTTLSCWHVSLINELLHWGAEWGRETIAQAARNSCHLDVGPPKAEALFLSVEEKVSLGRGSEISSPRPQIPQCVGREGALLQSLAPWSAARLYPVLALRLGPGLLRVSLSSE